MLALRICLLVMVGLFGSACLVRAQDLTPATPVQADEQGETIYLPQVTTPSVEPEQTQDGEMQDDEERFGFPDILNGGVLADQGIILDMAAAGKSFYVDCSNGNDNRDGRSPANAWKSIGAANQASLAPGDRLLFRRGCSWTGPLDANWVGTAAQPITIGAYGSGALPRIQDAYSSNVRIGGAYQVLENLHATLSTPPNPDPNCRNQPVAWKAGFAFQNGGHHNTVRQSMATKLAIGIFFNQDTHDNKALYNTITDNNVVWDLTQNRTIGAMGILLQGNAQEVGHNYFSGNKSICTYNGIVESNSIELYTASNAYIHHNISDNDRVFSEMGSSSTIRSESNTYAYNLHIASAPYSAYGPRFVVTRGWNHVHGPVLNTMLYNNTVYLTGPDSKGVVCEKCGDGILTLKSNILWADDEPFYSSTKFIESNNIFWSGDGMPLLHFRDFTMSPSSRIADPHFNNPAQLEFNLRAQSPAIDRASGDPMPMNTGYDLVNSMVPVGGMPDAGAYEFRTGTWQQVFPIPGQIEAENYKEGGPGTGYYDTTTGNAGGAYRNDRVDIEVATDAGGGYNVGWIKPNEWLVYEIDVQATGTYRLYARVSTPSSNKRFHVEIDGNNVSGSVTIPWTGGWQNWVDVPVLIPLTEGRHTLKIVAETDRFNLNYLTFNRIQ